jgi:hypothetical protein
MISERQLANGFQELWGEVLPTLTPHFVHLFNEAYRQQLASVDSSIPSQPETDASMVAEFAFHVARLAHDRGVPYCDVEGNVELLSTAETVALGLIKHYEKQTAEPRAALSAAERSEGLLLVRNYDDFLSRSPAQAIEFRPPLQGSGFVDACSADLSIGNTLFEVKTVERNIAGKDIRQILVYLALQAATGSRRWARGGFFNPRRGLVYEFSVDKLISLMSGGRLAVEVFQDMLRFFGTRDIQLDSAF